MLITLRLLAVVRLLESQKAHDLGELDLRMGDIDTDVVVIDGESYTPRKCRETKVQAGFIAHVKSNNSQA